MLACNYQHILRVVQTSCTIVQACLQPERMRTFLLEPIKAMQVIWWMLCWLKLHILRRERRRRHTLVSLIQCTSRGLATPLIDCCCQ